MRKPPLIREHAGTVSGSPGFIARFWAMVDKDADQDCWPWLGKLDRGGYGQLAAWRGDTYTTAMAHRVSYELSFGVIPDGLQLDHVRARGCTRRDCVNPQHLEPVTPRENLRRSPTNPSTLNALKTTCREGHALEWRGQQRGCGICSARYQAAYYLRKKLERKSA